MLCELLNKKTLFLSSVLFVSACGGGGGGGSSTPPSAQTYEVSSTTGTGGGISPATRTVESGATTTFTVSPDSGFSINAVTGCSGTLSGSIYTTAPITADCSISATFTDNSTPPPSSFIVSATAGAGGSINPATSIVNSGSATTFTVSPNTGFSIDSVNGCDGSLSGNTYTTGVITADCSVAASFSTLTSGGNIDRVAFITYDRTAVNTDELYAVNLDGLDPVRLHPDLVSGGNVSEFEWVYDGSRIVYFADQEVDGRQELYSVLPDGSSNTKLNGLALDGAGVTTYKLSPDSQRIAYLARENASDTSELYTVSVDGSDRQRVNQSLISGGNVVDFEWSPDSQVLLYIADLEANEQFELYVVNSDGTNHMNVNPDLAATDGIIDYKWSPLGGYISYLIIDRSGSTNDYGADKILYTYNMTSRANAEVIPSSQITVTKWSSDDAQIVAGVGDLDRTRFGYRPLMLNSSSGGNLITLSNTDLAYQFEFVPASNNLAVVYGTGSFNGNYFELLSGVNGRLIDSENVNGVTGIIEGNPFDNEPDAFYEAIMYQPFSFSPNGRYIVINSTTATLYDIQTQSALELQSSARLRPYRSQWIGGGNSILLSYDDGSYEPETFKRFFINPTVVNTVGTVLADMDQILGGDVSVARAVNPKLVENNILFERYPTTERPLMTVGVDGLGLTVLSSETALEIEDSQVSADSTTVVYTEGCSIFPSCFGRDGLYSVNINGSGEVKINPLIHPSTGVKAFSIQP